MWGGGGEASTRKGQPERVRKVQRASAQCVSGVEPPARLDLGDCRQGQEGGETSWREGVSGCTWAVQSGASFTCKACRSTALDSDFKIMGMAIQSHDRPLHHRCGLLLKSTWGGGLEESLPLALKM